MAATSKRQRVLFTREPQTPAKRLPTINLIEATPSTPSSSTSSALAPRTDGGRPAVRRVVPRNAKTPSRLPIPVSKKPTGTVHRTPTVPETPPPPLRLSAAEEGEPPPAPAKIPAKSRKGSLKPLHLLQRAAQAKLKEISNTPKPPDSPEPPDSPRFVDVGVADTPPSGPSANPSASSSLTRLAPLLDDPDISEVVIVPKQKKRPGLDFDWARGGVIAPESKPLESQDIERPASVKLLDRTSWWSTLGRVRKKEKENENAERGSLRSILRSRAASIELESDTQAPRSRTNTLKGALLLVLPKPPIATATETPDLPPTTSQESLRGPRAPKSRNGTTSSIASISNRSDVSSEGTVKNGSLAVRAIRSVRSLASVWGSVKEKEGKEGKESKKRNGSEVPVAAEPVSAPEGRGAAHKRCAALNANGLPMAPGTGRHTAARAGPSREQNATPDLTRQSSDTFSAESSGSRHVSGASILSTGRRVRFSTDSHAEGEGSRNADAYAGCTFTNQDPDEDPTRTSRTSKSSVSIRWSEHVLEAEREKAKRKSMEVMRRVSAPLPTFNQTKEEKMPNIEPKKRAALAGLFDLHIPSPTPTQVEFSPIEEQCESKYGRSSQRSRLTSDVAPNQLPGPSTGNYIDPDVRNEGSIRSTGILRPRTASEIFFDHIRPSSMFEPDLNESISALPYLNTATPDLDSFVEGLDPSRFTPDGTLFNWTRRGAIANGSPLDDHSSDDSLRDSLRASTMTIKPSKTTKAPPPEMLIPPEPHIDQMPDRDLVETEPVPDLFEPEPPAPAPAPESPVFSRLTAPPVRRPSAGLLKRVAGWAPVNNERKELETPVASVRGHSVFQPKQQPAATEETPQLSTLRIRPGIVSRAISMFDTGSDTVSTKHAPIRPLRLKRTSIVSQEQSSTANSSGMSSPGERTFGEPPSRPTSGYFEEDEGYPSQPRLPSRILSVRERVAGIDKLAQISNGLENPRTRQRVSPEGKQALGSLGSMGPEVQEDELDCDDHGDGESVFGPDIPDDLREELSLSLSSQASPLRTEDLRASLTGRRSTGPIPPDLASSQRRSEEELYASYASRLSFDFSAELVRVGLDKHLLGDLQASYAELMDDADEDTTHILSESLGSSRAGAYDAEQDLQAVLRSGTLKQAGSTKGLPRDLAALRLRGVNHVPNEVPSLGSTQSSLVWKASLSSQLSAGKASSDDNVSLALSFKIAPIQRAPLREVDGHIIDLGEDEDEIFFRSTSSMPRSRSSQGDLHGLLVPHSEQGHSASSPGVARENHVEDVFLSLRQPTQTPWMIEDIFGLQTGDNRYSPKSDLVATTSALGASLDNANTDPYVFELNSSTASASSDVTIEDTFNFTKKGIRQPGLSDRTLRLGEQVRHTPPQDPLGLSVPYGARPPTGLAEHGSASFASSNGSRVSASEESEKSPLEMQSDAQQGASLRDSGAPSATSSGSDLSVNGRDCPGIGAKLFTSPALLEPDTVSEPTVCPGIGTLIDPIVVGVVGKRWKELHTVGQHEQTQPSTSSPSAPTSTSQPVPLLNVPVSPFCSVEVKALEPPSLEEQPADLRAILMSSSKPSSSAQTKKRRRTAVQTRLLPQTDDEVEHPPSQPRGREELPMTTSSKHGSEHFEKEATSFSTEVIDSTVDDTRLKRPQPKARTRRHTWNKTPQKPKLSRSSGPSKDKKKSRHASTALNSPKPVSTLAKENRARQGIRSRTHIQRRDITPSQISVVREIIKEIQEEAPALWASTQSHHSSASDYSLASLRRGPNNAVDIVEGADNRTFRLYRYRTLRQEAQEEVNRSRYVWEDTPSSKYALNSFHPPRDRKAITEFLDFSQKNYINLPREYRRRNRRSRFSPYQSLSSSKGASSPLKRSTTSSLKRSTTTPLKRSITTPLKRSTTSQDHRKPSVPAKSPPTKPQESSAGATLTKSPIFSKPTSSSAMHIRSKPNQPKNIFSAPRDAPKQSTSSTKSRDTNKENGHSTPNGEREAQGPLTRAPGQPRLAKSGPRSRATPPNNPRSNNAHPPPFRV